MHTEPSPSQKASNPDVQYEKTDAAPRPLYQFLFWIAAITVLTAVLAWFVLRGLQTWREGASQRALMAEPQDSQQAPAPRLLTRENLNLRAFQKEEAEILSSYGVVDREKGTFRIPIDEAMRLTVLRGLPVAASSAKPAASKTTQAERK